MNDDKAPKKSWTSPTLEALEMASTAGGGDPNLTEEIETADGSDS